MLDRLVAAQLTTTEPGVVPNRAAGAALPAGGDQGAPEGVDRHPADEVPQTLRGRSVVVTGSLEGYTREEAEAAIVGRGGKSPSSVSARTFAVVLGAEPGAAKLAKAEALGVPVVAGQAFDQLLATGELPA